MTRDCDRFWYPTQERSNWIKALCEIRRIRDVSVSQDASYEKCRFAMAMLKKPYRESVKKNMPARWFDDTPHTHLDLDDAIEQGALFCNILAENRETKR